MKKETKIINFFGSANAGKTTVAAGLFHLMKLNRYSVELVQECAKELVYENPSALKDQFFVTAMQAKRINRLIGKVDFVISDSPLLLGEVYKSKKTFLKKEFFIDLFNHYDNINFFLNRTFNYVPEGRLQTEVEASEISKSIKQLLNQNGIKYLDMAADKDTHELVFRLIDKEFRSIKLK